MLIDGKKIRDEILAELKDDFESIGGAVLAVVWVGNDQATAKFIAQKQKFASAAGVELRLFEYEANIAQADLETAINRLARDDEIKGIIVQLPLPVTIDSAKIISLIPSAKDVDALTENAKVDSPVVQAIKEILVRYSIPLTKKFLVLGQGKLVGRPVSLWLAKEGVDVKVATSATVDISSQIKGADVIISGVGVPGLIKPDMLNAEAVLIDAGTSEQAGKLAGDADQACADKVSLFTPVPGGVGPIVLAMLFKNLWNLSNLT